MNLSESLLRTYVWPAHSIHPIQESLLSGWVMKSFSWEMSRKLNVYVLFSFQYCNYGYGTFHLTLECYELIELCYISYDLYSIPCEYRKVFQHSTVSQNSKHKNVDHVIVKSKGRPQGSRKLSGNSVGK